MKRLLSIILAVLILVSVPAFAEMSGVGQMSQEAVFNQAISLLRYYNQPESLEQAKEIFSTLPGSYNQASYFANYSQVMLDLQEELYEKVYDKLDTLKEFSGYESFCEVLQSYGLPSCSALYLYTQAKQAESEKHYSDAYDLYTKADILDALDRAIELSEYKPVLADPSHLKYTINNNKCTITKYTGNDKYIIIPTKLEGCPVTTIGDEAFLTCSSLVEITIPNGVTSIGRSAFEECISLTRVIIPDSVTSIGWSAFWHCKSLAEITIPDSVTSIGDYAFGYCTALTSISIPDSAVGIGENPLMCSWNLAEIKISSNHPTLTIIDGVLFHKTEKRLVCYPGAFDAKAYTIPQDTLTIDRGAFFNCNLSTIYISDSVVSINLGAFKDCGSLTSITIPDSVTSIGDDAFKGCPSLTVYCEAGSYAEEYARQNGIKFALI